MKTKITMKPFSFLTQVYPDLATVKFIITDSSSITKNYLDDDSDISFRLIRINNKTKDMK